MTDMETRNNRVEGGACLSRLVLPRWVRLTEEGHARVHEEYLAAYHGKACKEWPWFCQVIDYHEGCARTSLHQTWRSIAIRALIFLAEKIAAIKS